MPTRFIYIDVGAVGAESDGGVWAWTELNHLLEEHKANLLDQEPLPNQPGHQPNIDYFLVGDDAFPLRNFMMKPYPLRALPGGI